MTTRSRFLILTAFGLLVNGAGLTACQRANEGFTIRELSPEESAALMAESRREQKEEQINKVGGPGGRVCKYISDLSKRPPQGTVALTFDDGPSPELTPVVLGILRKYRIHATFFMLGEHAEAYPHLVRLVRSQGHLIGNHTVNHLNFHQSVVAETGHQITLQDRLDQILGPEAVLMPYMRLPLLFRYPYGNATCETNDFLHKRGYHIVGWHVDSCDWGFPEEGPISEKYAQICEVLDVNRSSLVDHVMSEVRNHGGGIILMHDVQRRTAQSLENLILALKREGYQFRTLDHPGYRALLR